MRSLPVQYGTIQIAAVAGELRYVSVSGVAKARLLWIFRNFRILDFSVLNKKEQQLIAQVWQAGPSAGSAQAFPDLIGTIEGFSPQPYQPSASVTRSGHSARSGLPHGLRASAIWTAMGILLLGSAICLGPRHELMPQTPIAAVAATNVATTNDAGSTVNLTQTSAESMPPVSNFPAVVASEASSVPPVHPADASTHDASSLQEKLPHPQVAVSAKALKKPEVMIRVSVDHEGRAQAFHILQGDKKKIPAAMEAARRWSFQPCSGPADCEHLLKFTDRGDASIMQMID